MSLSIPARPTTYRGIDMRSRLEAKTAAWMDDAGFTWVYEPRAFAGRGGQYLPDFEITLYSDGNPPARRTFVEVRPTVERALLACERMAVIWESVPDATLIVMIPEELMLRATGILEPRCFRVFG